MYDDIVIGAGSAGAVIAARLSEDPGRRILLIEAGPDYESLENTPHSLINGFQPSFEHDWGYSAEMVEGRTTDYARGKVTGGCSAVNACVALRGIPADYDEWSELGNTEWSWQNVRPVFHAMEYDSDFDDEHHGRSGPTLLRRYSTAELTSAQLAFYRACTRLGFPETADHHHPESTGVGTGPWNINHEGVRQSTALTYLAPARARAKATNSADLTGRPDTLVDRLALDGSRVTGVELLGSQGREFVAARRVTLSAGAVGTPTILLRSGIGRAEELRALGIGPKLELPGVRHNLIDHASVAINWSSPADIVHKDSPYLQTICRYTAQGSSNFNDMQVMLFQALPQPALRLRALLMKPKSRGRLQLRSSDPSVAPDIHLSLLSAPEDMRRMHEGIRMLGKLIELPELTDIGANLISLDDGEVIEAQELQSRLLSNDWAKSYAHRVVRHYVHPVGTARMGSSNDEMSMVDQYCQVHGIANLRVADALVMPTISSANTNLACIMIGERVASWLRTETPS